jgi:putative transposase
MDFETEHIYHVFNRGNNREMIFYEEYNYQFFIEKIRSFIAPYADILAWCLMPNHFHLMIIVNRLIVNNVSINDSIGRMLSSYTRAINNQEGRTGSLFQKKTKAVCLTKNFGITPAWYKQNGVTIIFTKIPDWEYPNVCMSYIHSNPVKDGLVERPENWEYSSFKEYISSKSSTLINKSIGSQYFI